MLHRVEENSEEAVKVNQFISEELKLPMIILWPSVCIKSERKESNFCWFSEVLIVGLWVV